MALMAKKAHKDHPQSGFSTLIEPSKAQESRGQSPKEYPFKSSLAAPWELTLEEWHSAAADSVACCFTG
jgi:hypothetical protein